MANPNLTAKEEVRIEKERVRRRKEKDQLQKNLVKKAQGRNRWRVQEALRRAKQEEVEKSQRLRNWKRHAEVEDKEKLRQYKAYLKNKSAREREDLLRLRRPRQHLHSESVTPFAFSIRVGALAGIVGFFATLAVGSAAGAAQETQLFWAVVVVLLFLGASLLSPYFMEKELSTLLNFPEKSSLGRIVDRVVEDDSKSGSGGGT